MIRAREAGFEVEGDAHLVAGVPGPQRLGGQPVAEQLVMHHVQFGARADQAGGVPAGAVPEMGDHPGLVEGHPVPDPIPEPGLHRRGVVGERMRRAPYPPPALLLEALREIPVEERDERLDAGFQQPVHQPVVEVQTYLVDQTPPLWHHPGPGHREPVGRQSQILHDPDVFPPPVVVVAGHITRVAVQNPPGSPAETVPDALRSPVLGHRSLDLVRGRGHPPEKTVGERPGHEPSTAPSRPSSVRTPCTGPAVLERLATSKVPPAGTRTGSSPKLR